MRRSFLFVLPVVLLGLSARAELVDRVAAVVNADIVALSEVEARAAPELAKLKDLEAAKRAEQRQLLLKRSLDLIIGEKLIEAQARELNFEATDTDIDAAVEDVKKQNGIDGAQFEQLLGQEGYTMASYRAFMKKHLTRMKIVNLKVRGKVKIADEDLKAEYAKLVREETQDFEVHARHLLVQLPAKPTDEQVEAARVKADALMQEAKKPGVDFAELAKAKSEGPSASDGGDLGFFRRGTMVAEFERAAFKLENGGVSEPVRTKFGWHVIKVEERRSTPPKPFEELKDAIRERLLRGQLEKYTEQYVDELRQGAAVVVKI